jgi:stearoyl-CoA desaturase (Delta-9 desaturase)
MQVIRSMGTGALRLARIVGSWFDSSAIADSDKDARRVEWLRTLPFVGVHLACVGIIWVGVSTTAVLVAVAMYALRMIAITGFYHRYFSHRAFRTSRFMQFIFAVLGSTAVQRGPLWWAAHHRHHHTHSDQEDDSHSPVQHGFWWSHTAWFMTRKNFATRTELVPDLAAFPELRFLDRFDVLMPVLLAVALFFTGSLLERVAPGLHTSGGQLLIWGFFVSTVALYHGTFTINSLAHVFGKRRYATRDQSRNNWWLAIITFGEGWHNNHHHFPGSVRQGFYWWEIDVTYYVLRTLSMLGLIWDLKTVPARIRDARREPAAQTDK